MEWFLLGLWMAHTCAEGKKRAHKAEKAERRRQQEEEREFKEFLASLEGLSEEEKAERWRYRSACIIAANQVASIVACSLCIF
jgi:hypothetical protein